jgi:diguanylate cyclase (GGDEF)-like protein/PAS domain S-box-containing protein
MTPLPLPARVLVATVCAAALGLGATVVAHFASAGVGPIGPLLLLGALGIAAWTRPLIVYRGDASEAVHADEGLLLIALLLLPPAGVLAVVAAAAAVGQVAHRRRPLKAVFNWAEVVAAAAVAVVVTRSLGLTVDGAASAADAGVAVVGVLTFFALSALIIAGIIAATSSSTLRAALNDGAELRLLVAAIGCVVAAPIGLAARSEPWAIVLLPPLYLVVRWVVAGHFDARHDRDRLLGLFDATLAVHEPLAADDVRGRLVDVASDLLRCPDADLSPEPAAGAALGSAISMNGATEWLVLSGRPHAEPFDDADQRLLDALAAVGRSALSHAEMYARAQRQSDELGAIMLGLAEGVIAFDADARPVYVNPAGAALLASTPEALTGDAATQGAGDATLASLTAVVRRCLHSMTPLSDEAAVFLRVDASTFPVSYTCAPLVEDGRATGAVLVFRDVSERVAAERQLAHNAFHDELTGLPNRRLFIDRLDQALRRGERRGATHAVLIADVDRFKQLNDNLGQQAGDELLQEIGRRICRVARPSDTVARLGGDEFTVLAEDIQNVGAAQRLAARILNELSAPVHLGEGREVVASVSIGIATTEAHSTVDDVLHDADVAMSQAKTAGAGGVHSYDAAAMRARSAVRFDIETDLRAAIANEELEVYYQPLVDLSDDRMHDVEALIRWPDPKQGMRMPGDFIPLAEESGLILPLGRFVLIEAARQATEWDGSGVEISVAVNLSARQFQDHGLIPQIENALRISKLAPERLCLEITESLAMQDMDLTIRTLGRLKALGVQLAIDDFGTGHSSLNYLKRFPVDEVKIDRSFVRDVDSSQVDRAIIAAIVGLANALDIRTVVEGIEDEAQLERVRALGCTLAQGYHLSVPKPADQMTQMLVGSRQVPAPRQPARTIDLTTRAKSHL